MIPLIRENETSAENIIAHFHPDYFLVNYKGLENKVQGYKYAVKFITKNQNREKKALGKKIR
jgi:hypothetical protein